MSHKNRDINNGKTTRYFKLKRRQGQTRTPDFSISPRLSVSGNFRFNANPNIESLKFFNYNFLYSAYADDAALFYVFSKNISLINPSTTHQYIKALPFTIQSLIFNRKSTSLTLQVTFLI